MTGDGTCAHERMTTLSGSARTPARPALADIGAGRPSRATDIGKATASAGQPSHG
jgi:hypothetical protein